MAKMQKTLKKMSGMKAGYGWSHMTTYREDFHLSFSHDEVIVQLKKEMFPSGGMPDEINVTVEWEDQGNEQQ